MPFETPQYMANNLAPARIDRLMLYYVFGRKERVLEGLVVGQRAAGANSSVDVTAGAALVIGDYEPRSGAYLVISNASAFTAGFENFVMPVKPGSNSRVDVVGVLVRDAQAAGAGTDNDAILSTVSGTTGTSPSEPTIPSSFLPLARVLRTSAETGILAASITDVAPRAQYPFGSGDNPPTAIGVAGDFYAEW